MIKIVGIMIKIAYIIKIMILKIKHTPGYIAKYSPMSMYVSKSYEGHSESSDNGVIF